MRAIDLNADLGEGSGYDEELMDLVSSCNIACGGHAGDDESMRAAVFAAQKRGVVIGAHPSYEDPDFFGRRPLALPTQVVIGQIRLQIHRLLEMVDGIHHIKLHGALYHRANQDSELAKAVAELAFELMPKPLIYAPPTGHLIDAARTVGLPVLAEGFMDRRYLESGELCPRSETNAVIEDPAEAVEQALMLATEGRVIATNGKVIPMNIQTLCVHGDSPSALELLRSVRESFKKHGMQITSC